MLHPKQQEILDLLKKNIDEPLTLRGIQKILSISSSSLVHHHLVQLEKRGYLKRNPANPQDYQILSDSPEKNLTFLNLYGLAKCGPDGSILTGNPLEKIPVSTRILNIPSQNAFLVKASGDSMKPRIRDGDLVLVERTNNTCNSGDIIVCVNNEIALIKKYTEENGQRFLISLNPDYQPIIPTDDFRVEGKVKGLISYFY